MRFFVLAAALVSSLGAPALLGQLATRGDAGAPPVATNGHRTRLILKDGTFQVVMSYKVVGTRVEYVSAERAGETEEISTELVDLDATKKWEARHSATTADGAVAGELQKGPPVLDPELAKEEADRVALTPEVAPDLRLVAEDAILGLDTFRGGPELVPLEQSDGDLNRQTGHSVLRGLVKPNSSAHQLLVLKGEKAAVQMHVNDPVFYVRLDDAVAGGSAMTVDTGGASSSDAVKEKKHGPSTYSIVRVDVRQDARVVASFNTAGTDAGRATDDTVATTMTVLPGGHWGKLVPAQNLLIGEYCLVEVLGNNSINLSVWDFGVHPTAPENRDVLHPEKPRPAALQSRPRD